MAAKKKQGQEQEKITALYCRLSQDDGLDGDRYIDDAVP
jgi:hypothetical protein